jgi:hypothetical protein
MFEYASFFTFFLAPRAYANVMIIMIARPRTAYIALLLINATANEQYKTNLTKAFTRSASD